MYALNVFTSNLHYILTTIFHTHTHITHTTDLTLVFLKMNTMPLAIQDILGKSWFKISSEINKSPSVVLTSVADNPDWRWREE